MLNPQYQRYATRALGSGVLAVVALTLAGAAASANFRLDVDSTPGAAGEAFSATRRLSGYIPESAAGPVAFSANFVLNTDMVPEKYLPDDQTAPVITVPPTVIYVGHDRAVIEWQTNELADSFVEYGLTTAYGQVFGQFGVYATLHQIIVTGLSPATQFNFRVRSTDPFENGPVFSGNGFFTTLAAPDATAPAASAPLVTILGTTSAQLDFTTNEPAQTDLRHGPTPALGQSLPDDVWRLTHTRTLTGLVPASSHSYAVDTRDASGNQAAGTTQDFALPADVAFVTSTLPSATRGNTYSVTIAASGGVGARDFSVVSGALPPGITLGASSGLLFGEPQQAGAYTFTLRLSDSGTPASTADLAFTLAVNAPAKKSSDDGCAASPGTSSGLALLALLPLALMRRRARRA